MDHNTNNFPKILILTRNAWNINNCTGNTLSNFFAKYPNDKIFNAFFRAEKINNSICNKYFNASENDLIKNFFNKENIGRVIETQPLNTDEKPLDASKKSSDKPAFSFYSLFSGCRWTVFLWLRDLLWGLNGWKNKKYDAFLDDVKPEVIYMPCYDSVYMHKILWYTAKKTGAKIVLFTGDDTYTLKQFNLSLLWWINRFIYRGVMRKSVKKADTLFVISELQKKEYDKIFKRDCVLLRKGENFDNGFSPKKETGNPIKLVYTGNIHSGRWKTLAIIAKSIQKINENGIKMQMDIYSLTPKSAKMTKSLNIDNCCRTMPPASDYEIKKALLEADLLVFTEPFGLREKLMWRLSFSTKLVDYLASSRAIFAVGPKELASMNFLVSNDCAFFATKERDIFSELKKIAENPNLIQSYAQKAWQCGQNKTRAEHTEKTLFNHLMEVDI